MRNDETTQFRGCGMTSESKRKVTMVGLRQAKVGFTFLHSQPTEECVLCELLRTCMISLEIGRVYAVTRVRDKTFPCQVHEEGVRVVEVEEPPLDVAIEHRIAFPLGVIAFRPQECKYAGCKSIGLCQPQGLVEGDRCKILEVKERLICPLDRRLVRATVRREAQSA